MTTTPPARPLLDHDLLVLLAVVCDLDRGESPFGWSPPAPLTATNSRHGQESL